MDRRIFFAFAAAGAALLAARPALAVDGVIEINQARALAGGITVNDFAGYPIRINAPGSYRLTGNLTTDGNNSGIEIWSDDVTLDLNGFTLTCAGGLNVDGIAIPGFRNVEIRNGTVRGCTRNGIFTNINTHFIRVIGVTAIGNAVTGIDLQGQGNIIDGCTALNNPGGGMRAFEGSLVTDSIARGNAGPGLTLVGGSGYRSCVFTANNGGDAQPQVSGGFQLGTNVCGTDTICP